MAGVLDVGPGVLVLPPGVCASDEDCGGSWPWRMVHEPVPIDRMMLVLDCIQPSLHTIVEACQFLFENLRKRFIPTI